MATTSSILQLALPDEFDKVDVKVLTDNFSKIDVAVGQKVDKDDIINDLTDSYSDEQKVLHVHQGYVLNTKITDNTNRIKTLEENNVTKDIIVNNLTSEDTQKPLSAAQGAILNQTKLSGAGLAVEVPIHDWVGEGPYTRDVLIPGVLADETKCFVIVSPHPDYFEHFSNTGIRPLAQKDGAITFQVQRTPVETFNINVLVLILGAMEVSE